MPCKHAASSFHRPCFLLSDVELGYDSTVSLDIDLHQIVKQISSVAAHFKKSATAVMVVVVLLKMLGERVDSAGQESDLNLGRACVAFVCRILLDNSELLFFGHFLSPHINRCANSATGG